MKKSVLMEKLIEMTGKPKEVIEPSLTHIHIQLCGVSGEGGRFGEADIPSEYSSYFLSNAPARKNQEKIYQQLEKYVKSFKRFYTEGDKEDSAPLKSVYLWSANKGNGKSSTSAALLNEFMMMGWKASVALNHPWFKPPAYFFDVNEFQTLYNKFTRNGIASILAEEASMTYYEMMEKASNAPLVVFDDIGVRSATEAFRADLHTIINKRIVNGLPSIYTSNHPIDYLEEVFDERLADRVRDNCIVLEFKGASKRGVKK